MVEASLLQEYLDELPEGLQSYPDCRTKGSAVRLLVNGITDNAQGQDLDKIPVELKRLLHSPPATADWVPGVHYTALNAIFVDECFSSREESLLWVYSAQTRFLGGKIYAPLFKLLPTATLLAGAQRRYCQFHQGVEVDVQAVQTAAHRVTLTFPSNFMPVWRLNIVGESIRAGLDLSGVSSRSVLVSHTQTSAIFEVSWGELVSMRDSYQPSP
jgi:hypothetical protein